MTSLLPLLLDAPLLRILSHLQRTLDPLDIEGLSTLWKLAHLQTADDPPLGFAFPEPSIDDWQAFLRSYLDDEFQRSLSTEDLDATKLPYYCLAYLLSASFKDCSLILRLGRGDGQPDTITAIDLGPKSVTRLAKWAKLDSEIVSAFMDFSDDRVCVDSGNL